MFNRCIASRKNIGQETFPDDTIMEIIRYASLAGSSHNTQPWLVDIISDTLLHIRADYTRKLSVVDPAGRGLYISLGAFLENLCLAARHYDNEPKVYITAGSSRDNLVAEVSLTRNSEERPGPDAMERVPEQHEEKSVLIKIEERSTLREPFSKDEVRTFHIEKLIGSTTDCYHFFLSASAEGSYIARNTLEAYIQQCNNEAAKQELAGWIRFSNSDVRKRLDGLTTSGMGINGFGGVIVSRLYKPEDSKKQSFIVTGIEKARAQTVNCGGWLIITQPEDTPECWIETGRLYQRAHLECRDLMIGFHPMNQMIEVEEFEQKANEYLGLEGKIQFVARIGYVDDYPAPVSVRRPVPEFTTLMKCVIDLDHKTVPGKSPEEL